MIIKRNLLINYIYFFIVIFDNTYMSEPGFHEDPPRILFAVHNSVKNPVLS
jgi:hypothetical protein